MSQSIAAGVTPNNSYRAAAAKDNGRRSLLSRDQEQQFITYGTTAQNLLMNLYTIRSGMEFIDRAYMRELDYTTEQAKARLWNALGDPTKFQNITVPIVMPQVRAALGYMVNVFLTGYPIFGVASDPTNMDAAKQIETIIAENATTAKWARELMMFFQDGLKYNLHAIEVAWEQKVAAQVVTDPTQPSGARPVQTLWTGNVLRRMDLYNTFFDPRVHPADIAEKGEFVGYNEILSRTQLKAYLNSLFNTVPVDVVERALASTYGGGAAATGFAPYSYYIPMLNPMPLMNNQMLQQFDWMSWANVAKKQSPGVMYGNVYTKTVLYCRIVPSDFDLRVPAPNTPQVWKLVYINGQVIVECERLTQAHNYIPIFFGQPLEDGLRLQTKSFAANVIPMQEVGSAMMNGWVASKRRLIGDRMIYDPLRIREKDINSDSPTAKIPVRPAAYGKPLNEAVFPIPFRDDATASLTAGADLVMRYANMINQQNPAQQGQFVKGNKTLREYEDVMGHGNAGNQVMAIATETQVFTPMKEVIKLNIMLYQQKAVMYNPQTRESVSIDPVALRQQAVVFKVSDGLVPTEKQMGSDEFAIAVQAVASSPQLQAGYNLAPMFSYLAEMQGAHLKPFEKTPEQMQYEQALGVWQQMAALALEKGGTFNTPMPQPPPQQPQGPPASTVALQATQGTTV